MIRTKAQVLGVAGVRRDPRRSDPRDWRSYAACDECGREHRYDKEHAEKTPTAAVVKKIVKIIRGDGWWALDDGSEQVCSMCAKELKLRTPYQPKVNTGRVPVARRKVSRHDRHEVQG